MSDATTHLLLPYILAAQAQKHVTHNEALRILDGLVQLSVLDRDLAAPPASPADGDRYIVASGATGDWAGWDLNVALWTDGAWLRLPPRTGWRAWVDDEGLLLVYDGATWIGLLAAAVAGVCAYTFLTVAMRTGQVGAVTPFRYTRLIFAMIAGIAVFGETPDRWTIIGSAVIILAGIAALRLSRQPATVQPA